MTRTRAPPRTDKRTTSRGERHGAGFFAALVVAAGFLVDQSTYVFVADAALAWAGLPPIPVVVQQLLGLLALASLVVLLIAWTTKPRDKEGRRR